LFDEKNLLIVQAYNELLNRDLLNVTIFINFSSLHLENFVTFAEQLYGSGVKQAFTLI